MHYNVIIIGGGPGGIFSAYELTDRSDLRVAVFEAGHSLEKAPLPHRRRQQSGSCIRCKSCSIMSGFGGAGAFSDGKYNITNDFGGTLHEYIGKKQALDLMHYVDRSTWLTVARARSSTHRRHEKFKSSAFRIS